MLRIFQTLVKRLWTEDAVSVESDVCRLDKVSMAIRPIQRPHPPIWFAATTDQAVRRAARLGDTWFILGSPEECYAQLRPAWETLGVNHLTLRTHWCGLPLRAALQSMRLISDELLPALRRMPDPGPVSRPSAGTGT